MVGLMNIQEQEQIRMLLQNIEDNQKRIPTFSDLRQHPVFGASFAGMESSQKQTVELMIKQYIADKVDSLTKTKGGQLFKRFFESSPELFWQFRALNESDESAQSPEFQVVGKRVEQEMFRLEGILTDRMLKQEKGLDKVIDSFYNIVYLFFPRYNCLD